HQARHHSRTFAMWAVALRARLQENGLARRRGLRGIALVFVGGKDGSEREEVVGADVKPAGGNVDARAGPLGATTRAVVKHRSSERRGFKPAVGRALHLAKHKRVSG